LDFSVAGGAGDGAAGAAGVSAGAVAGAAGVASAGLFAGGVAGGVVVGTFAGTTDRLPARPETIVNARDVTMNMIAAAVVAFDSSVACPRCPNAVWLDPPPNVPDQSALLPCCSNTTRIRNKQTIT